MEPENKIRKNINMLLGPFIFISHNDPENTATPISGKRKKNNFCSMRHIKHKVILCPFEEADDVQTLPSLLAECHR